MPGPQSPSPAGTGPLTQGLAATALWGPSRNQMRRTHTPLLCLRVLALLWRGRPSVSSPLALPGNWPAYKSSRAYGCPTAAFPDLATHFHLAFSVRLWCVYGGTNVCSVPCPPQPTRRLAPRRRLLCPSHNPPTTPRRAGHVHARVRSVRSSLFTWQPAYTGSLTADGPQRCPLTVTRRGVGFCKHCMGPPWGHSN